MTGQKAAFRFVDCETDRVVVDDVARDREQHLVETLDPIDHSSTMDDYLLGQFEGMNTGDEGDAQDIAEDFEMTNHGRSAWSLPR